jgi:hypothetical protein
MRVHNNHVGQGRSPAPADKATPLVTRDSGYRLDSDLPTAGTLTYELTTL